MKTVTVAWQPERERFEARGGHAGQLIHINAPHANGGPTGFSASELLLAGAGSCSAWDVVEIMHKQRQRVTAIDVVVHGRQMDTPPFAFTHVQLHYRVSGHHLNADKVRKAVQLSKRKYCTVIGTIEGVAEVTCDVEVLEAGEPAAAVAEPTVAVRTTS
jgi:putative redox protein